MSASSPLQGRVSCCAAAANRSLIACAVRCADGSRITASLTCAMCYAASAARARDERRAA
eukprot:1621558-Prymnesium_polylepis.1